MRKLARNRTVIVGASLLGLLVVLGIAREGSRAERRRPRRARPRCQAPRFEVDPLWPKPLPNHWVLGQTIGVWVDTDDHVWIVHRSSATLADNEKGIEKKTADVLRGRAAGPRVRSGGQPAAALGRSGRRATNGPTATTASSSITRATSGLAATAAPDSHILKFTKDGKFLLQIGKKGARRKAGAARRQSGRAGRRLRRRQQRPDELRPRREDLRRPESERGLHRRRLSEQARRGARRRHRQDETVVGRVRQQAG